MDIQVFLSYVPVAVLVIGALAFLFVAIAVCVADPVTWERNRRAVKLIDQYYSGTLNPVDQSAFTAFVRSGVIEEVPLKRRGLRQYRLSHYARRQLWQ